MRKEFFEEYSFKENAELMNLEHQMENYQKINKQQNIGFNNDILYENIEQEIYKRNDKFNQ